AIVGVLALAAAVGLGHHDRRPAAAGVLGRVLQIVDDRGAAAGLVAQMLDRAGLDADVGVGRRAGPYAALQQRARLGWVGQQRQRRERRVGGLGLQLQPQVGQVAAPVRLAKRALCA